jgi:queuine tRNA-ribosyltransferase
VTAFAVTATNGAARAGVLRTVHGEVPTPAFMPVGTKGTVKGVDPNELRALGAGIVLGNTYHLHFKPGEDVVAELGGLHSFMAWEEPILTDSGGFQVFSLRDTLLGVDDDGVTFRSVYDGRPARFTPELAAEIQARLGSDIAMCLDVCLPASVPRAELAEATRRTAVWAARQRAAPRAEGQLLFGIAQAPTPSFDGARSTRSSRSTSTATRSAGSAWGRAESGCSTPSPGRRRCCRPSGRATSWASATPRASSR